MRKLNLIKIKTTNLFIVRKCFKWSRPDYPFSAEEIKKYLSRDTRSLEKLRSKFNAVDWENSSTNHILEEIHYALIYAFITDAKEDCFWWEYPYFHGVDIDMGNYKVTREPIEVRLVSRYKSPINGPRYSLIEIYTQHRHNLNN